MTADRVDVGRTTSGGADSDVVSKRGPMSDFANEFALVPKREGDDIYTKTMKSFKESVEGATDDENK